MQQRIQAYNNQVNQENNRNGAAHQSRQSGSSEASHGSQQDAEARPDIEDDEAHESQEGASFLQSPRINLYGNLALNGHQGANLSATEAVRSNSGGAAGINLGLSMGVNFGGSFGYSRVNNNRQSNQNNHSPRAQAGSHANNGPGDEGTERNLPNTTPHPNAQYADGEAEEEDCEDDDEEYESQNEEEGENEDEEALEEDENDLECYLRNVNIDTSRLRARTAPLRPMEHVEQFKMTPTFTNLEQAAVCAVQIV